MISRRWDSSYLGLSKGLLDVVPFCGPSLKTGMVLCAELHLLYAVTWSTCAVWGTTASLLFKHRQHSTLQNSWTCGKEMSLSKCPILLKCLPWLFRKARKKIVKSAIFPVCFLAHLFIIHAILTNSHNLSGSQCFHQQMGIALPWKSLPGT